MTKAPSEPIDRILDYVSLGLLAAGLFLRLLVPGTDPVWGTNLLIHAIPWVAAAVWCLARIVEGRFPARLSGLEGPIAAWILLCVVSIQRAPYKLGAIDAGVAFATAAALVPILLHVVGPDHRRLLAAFLQAACFAVSIYAILQVVVLLPHLRNSPEARELVARLGPDDPFVIRLNANQPWGTFIGPNTLAGFLVLTIPFALGAARDAAGNVPLVALRLIAAVAGLVALGLTGSRGGWGAFGMAAAAAVLLLAARWKPDRRRLILGAGLGLLLVALIGGWFFTSTREKSMQFRAAYAEGAVKAWKTAPITGIGLMQYEDAFPQNKLELQQETRKVHNDYVQILCELGVVGLAVFLIIILWILRHGLAPDLVPPAPESTPAMLAFGAGAVAALILAWIVTGDGILVACIGVAWIVSFLTNARGGDNSEFARLGLAAGFVGLLAHLAVDFDFYEYGMTTMFFVAAALLVLYARELRGIDGGRRAAIAAAVLTLLIAGPIAYGAMRFQSAESALAELKERQANSEITEGILSAAWANNPLDANVAASMAHHYMRMWRNASQRSDLTPRSIEDLLILEGLVMRSWDKAIARRPNLAGFYRLRGLDLQEMGRFYRAAAGKTRAANLPAWRTVYAEAVNNLTKAIELYPTRAAGHAALARLLDEIGREAEALPYYEEALRLSALAFDTPGLQLSPLDKARAFSRLGKTPDAIEPMTRVLDARLAEQMRTAGRKFLPDELLKILDDMRADPAKYLDESWHPSMQPALDRAFMELMDKVKANAEKLREK